MDLFEISAGPLANALCFSGEALDTINERLGIRR